VSPPTAGGNGAGPLPPAERGADGARILLAEDDAASARILRSILEQVGYQVTLAPDGETALRMLDADGAPDLLLLDWMLPGVSGLEVCHLARERWDALRLPILMVTARTDPESVYAAFDAGASDYIAKPFRGAELRARLAAHLRTRRQAEERAAMEEHLRERDKLFTLGLLAGGVAHDLNNPLAVISAHAQLLLRRQSAEEDAEGLREILTAVERCRRIAGGLLGFARRQPLELGPVDTAGVLRSTLEMREARLTAAGIEVAMDVAGDLPPVRGDAHQLQQVFLNVLVNAEQALAEGGRTFRVTARRADEYGPQVVIEFCNDGPPIPADQLPRVFEPLFTTKPTDEGTGLGLYICQRIVSEHGGEITVRSQPGETCFEIRLPGME
jgi:signal transduction histidine kinase